MTVGIRTSKLHQVPIEIGSIQGKSLAISWLLAAPRITFESKYHFQIKF